MTRLCRLFLCFVLALPWFAAAAPTPIETVLTQARRYVGKERDLEGIRSIHYRGRLEVRDSGGELIKDACGTVEMILQKPAQQKIVSIAGGLRDTVGLDDLTGWQRVEQVAEPSNGRTTILPMVQLRRAQAAAFENLSFYRGLEKRGGRIELRGETTVDGHAAVNVAFIHPGGIVFQRSFDRQTGRLLLTEGEGGEKMREEGEVVVGGIRFPQRLVSTRTNSEGRTFSVALLFDEIKVNETFPAETFAVPLVRSR